MTPSEIPTYSPAEARRKLEDELPGWAYEGGWIQRRVPVGSFGEALGIAAAVAHVAEAARHHPDLELGPRAVRIRIRHHWAAGVTDADFALARALRDVLP